ncbi:uncharacterized protein BP5553_06143 [Venustampulla echinocandica]|uniref:Peptidase A1 domain-containing protein n=1 Tax=Venustampulla echinocandica TaxID=2656787 RepID=A0A370TMQ1_9HELO|nr:uncharacterized protein BP5553_06143 [Venustampulla echinocandica]RDL36791.1 hypothetical protein BP5553_06143 [Venustampulla echinocandica]
MISWGPLPVFMVLRLVGLASGLLAATSSPSSSLAVRAVGPPPLVIPPSQLWEGNDGAWSTFWLSVGTPPQNVRVLASTASNQPWVILSEGCFSNDPSDCDHSRGGIFQTNASRSWYVPSWIKNKTSAVFTVAIESNLGLTGNAQYGYDNVSLGANSGTPSLSNQVVGGIATKEFFMGLFGLNPAATSFSTNNEPVPSYMSSLKTQNIIPSLSYGYTAGNKNRNDKNFGSLTLGGYDASLFEPNPLTVVFNSHAASDLTINVNHIATSSKDGTRALSISPFSALIDSTISHMYLPVEVCKQFEDAFGIVYDEASGLYLVNDTLHTQLLSQSPTVTFTLTNSTSKVMVDIALPYSAFDLSVHWPVAQNTTRYFPLKRAANNTQTTLGRTFLQEAYLIADYERSTFSIHQRKWDDNAQPNIQAIMPQSADSGIVPDKKNPVNIAAVVAGSIGGFVLITIIVGAVFMLRRRSQQRKASQASTGTSSSMPPGKTLLPSVAYSTSPSAAYPVSPSLASRATAPGRPRSVSFYGEDHLATDAILRSSGPNAGPVHSGSVASSSVRYPNSDYDAQTTRTRSPELEGYPGPYRSMASSPVYYPSDYDAQVMRTRSPELEGSPTQHHANIGASSTRNLSVRDIQRNNTRSPELEGSPVTPIAATNQLPAQGRIPGSEELDVVHELPARENVDRGLLDDSKKPAWI